MPENIDFSNVPLAIGVIAAALYGIFRVLKMDSGWKELLSANRDERESMQQRIDVLEGDLGEAEKRIRTLRSEIDTLEDAMREERRKTHALAERLREVREELADATQAREHAETALVAANEALARVMKVYPPEGS